MVEIVPSVEYRELDTMFVTAKSTPSNEEVNFELPTYNASNKREADLLHTKLDLRFNWEKEQVVGKASLVLKPYFYPVDELTLDAKGFDFEKISLDGETISLKYDYDNKKVTVQLGREFTRKDSILLVIDYVATPSKSGGSAAITSDKGLFFINSNGEEGKPQQIWTQGETENSSRWFPTIDKPNERCTQEMFLTVEDRFKTLSNGILTSSTKNPDGSRTDYWKMEQPHAPYLFMIAIGEYAVVEDTWNEIPVDYYVEPEYEEHARAIFPHTPEMLSFFSEKLGLPYPWQKYSQVVVRDFVSGAMENTTAVIFGEFVQRTSRELIDNRSNQSIVAHEMFHHWFGDYVTCESWSNLTLNEGFANYSEYLWWEHKNGKDDADYHLLSELRGYISSSRRNMHPLIDFGYDDKEDMFDAHSYNKGGLILHMLRNYVGDEAFWASLQKYLTDNAYSDVEAHELRLAFEDVTGEDLNWFFNQWFFSQGHPDLYIEYDYDEGKKEAIVKVRQLQESEKTPAIFQLPVAVDIYLEGEEAPIRKDVFVNKREQVFRFDVPEKPKLVNFDADKILLCEKGENKSDEEYLYQYYHGGQFLDRYEAQEALMNSDHPSVRKMFIAGLQDKHWALRINALNAIKISSDDENMINTILSPLIMMDPHSSVRAAALEKLAVFKSPKVIKTAQNVIENDSAYQVLSAALQTLVEQDISEALKLAESLEKQREKILYSAIGKIYAESGDVKYLSFFEDNWDEISGFGIISFFDNYQELLYEADEITSMKALKKLEGISTDLKQYTWKRYSATKVINEMRNEYRRKANTTKKAKEVEKLEAKVAELSKMMEHIKSRETNTRLKSLYRRFQLLDQA